MPQHNAFPKRNQLQESLFFSFSPGNLPFILYQLTKFEAPSYKRFLENKISKTSHLEMHCTIEEKKQRKKCGGDAVGDVKLSHLQKYCTMKKKNGRWELRCHTYKLYYGKGASHLQVYSGCGEVPRCHTYRIALSKYSKSIAGIV